MGNRAKMGLAGAKFSRKLEVEGDGGRGRKANFFHIHSLPQ